MREEKEEAERLQMDIEEAKFKATERKEAIEKAKTQQYYQTDRVKNFHVSCSSFCILYQYLWQNAREHTAVFLHKSMFQAKWRLWVKILKVNMRL